MADPDFPENKQEESDGPSCLVGEATDEAPSDQLNATPGPLAGPPDYHEGHGTPDDPYVVGFKHNDPHNPMKFSTSRKWFITSLVTVSVFAVTLTSSAYSVSSDGLISEFHCSREVFALGISLFVLGFAVGPPLWAPLSELYGRYGLYVVTMGLMTAFIAGGAGCKSIASMVVFRFLAGTFGASPLTNAGGVIADLFPASDRGLAMTIFGAAPFLGPLLGPIVGGFVTSAVGWRWVQGVCAIFVGTLWIAGSILLSETYAPILLKKKAKLLAKESGQAFISTIEKHAGHKSAYDVFATALKRPWVLLFTEPIVLVASIYLSILYSTIYMFFAAYPIVYKQGRGWSTGVSSLAFLGLVVGMLLGLAYTIVDNGRYKRLGDAATPESRLPPCMVGAVFIPVGMFAFAWTNGPSIHWSASVILAAPFGFGTVLVFIGILVYLIDSYAIYAASVLAATAMFRAVFAAAFVLFTTQMYHNLGIHWASSIPAFLTVACLPFPFVMYRYGARIRMKCKYAHEAAVLWERLHAHHPPA